MDQNLIDRITENEGQRAAFYNTIFFLLVSVCLGGLYLVYQMLHMFLTPLMFGALFGTVLFPLKRSFSSILNDWLNALDADDRPFLVGVALFPIQFLNKTATAIFNGIYSKQGLFGMAGYILIKILTYQGTFVALLSFFGRVYSTADVILDFLTQVWIIPLISLYTVAYVSWIYIQNGEELKHKKKFARALSLPIWITVLAFSSSFCGFLHVFVFTTSSILIALIASGVIGKFENDEEPPSVDKEKDPVEAITKAEEPAPILPEINLEKAITSDRILRIMGILFALLWTSKHDLVLIIILILFLYGFILNFADKLQLCDIALSAAQNTLHKEKLEKITTVVVPGFLRQFVYILFTSDRYLIGSLKQKVDLLASISVMVFLTVGVLFFGFFAAFQLHNETVHIGTLATNVVSSNPEWLKTAMNYTGEKLNEETMNNYAEQAYKQTREWLASNIRSLADPKDQKRADQLEQQAKILVDNLYHLYEERVKNLPENSTAIANRDWFTQLMSTTNIDSLKSEITQIVKENIETILSIAQQLWKILAANVSVLSTVLFSVSSFLFGFGFDLINLFIEILVFLLVAYYLLANSAERFLPIQWIEDATKSLQTKTSRTQIANAVENAISSVFVLSAKMSIFYFLFTYFIHSLFGLTVVFIPALLSSIFASIPIAPAYSVAIFGIVELYLVRGETAAAIVFSLANITPLFLVDGAFYSELKYVHPYIIGLSIVGGIYSMGVQGSVIGPILLCIMIVLLNVYAEYAKH